MLKRIIAIIVLIVIIVGAFLFYEFVINVKPATVIPKPTATTVTYSTAKPEVWHEQIQTTGTIKARQGITIKAQISGQVVSVNVHSGDMVTKGELLFSVDPSTLIAQQDQQKAQLKLDLVALAQQKRLYFDKEGPYTSKLDYEQAVAQVKTTEAKIKSIQTQINDAVVYAPIAGKVGLKSVDVGDYVQPGDELITLQNYSKLRVDFSVPEIYLKSLEKGQLATLTLNGQKSQKIDARVYAVNSQVTSSNRSIDVRADLINPRPFVKPGMFAEVDLQLAKKMKVLVIPQTAVVYAITGNSVFKVTDKSGKQTAEQVPVTLGERRTDEIAITKGLAANDTIVAVGTNKIRTGSLVVNSTPAATEKH